MGASSSARRAAPGSYVCVRLAPLTYRLPQLFLVMATQNPIEQEGTYPLPEAQLDRFLMHVSIGYPDAQAEKEILDLARQQARDELGERPTARELVTQEQVFIAQTGVLNLYMAPALEDYIVQLVLASRDPGSWDGDLSRLVSFGGSPPSGDVLVSGEVGDRSWSKRLLLGGGEDPESRSGHDGVASLWARRKITGLLDQKVTGREEAQVRADVLPVALRHHLLSPYTGFVAVEELVSRPAGEGVGPTALANTRPRGQSPQTFAYPRKATTGPAKAWFGVLALFVALLVRVLRQPEVDHVPRRRD